MPAPIDPDTKRLYNQRYYLKKKRQRRQEVGANERTVPLHVRVPATLWSRVQRVVYEGVATGRYPWRTMAEAVISLLNRGFASMKGDPFIDEMLPHLEMAHHLDRIQQQRREAQGVLAKARLEIAELLNIGAKSGAVTYYHVTMDAARKMPPTEWRDWLIAELRKAFPDLAKHAPRGVVLLPGSSKAKAKKAR